MTSAVVESITDEEVLAQPDINLRPPIVFGDFVVADDQERRSVKHSVRWREGTHDLGC